ncbi:hypothetical protein BFJ71_g1751 [Fusarium oxysporum]|nr:hypothetical protein BFJ71_g1751 [Fusarium oxysporum]
MDTNTLNRREQRMSICHDFVELIFRGMDLGSDAEASDD